MVAYNFKREFEGAIVSGRKCSTIRPRGKRKHAEDGDALQLYIGMRTRNCHKLADAVCTKRQAMWLYLMDDWGGIDVPVNDAQGVTWTSLDQREQEDIAHQDGFGDWGEMQEWFYDQYGPGEFDMVRICWVLIDAATR